MKHIPAISIFVLHFLIFAKINQYLNPHPDMLDHWVWSRYLSLSYYEHPPMIAWIIRVITFIGGNNEAALEIGSQLVSLSIIALIYCVTLKIYGQKPAFVTLIILCSMPYFTIGSIFLHITQPFLFFWIIALFLLICFHNQPDKKWLILIGVVAGLGALSKYIMVLFYLGLFIHLLIYRKIRNQIFNPWIYVAGIISLTFFIPVLFWNFQNDWISFRWQLGKGTSGADFGENTLAFTLGHIFLFSPFWFVMGLFGIWSLRDRLLNEKLPETVITVISILPLIFFTILSLKGSISDPHWANLSYLGIAILLGNELILCFQKKVLNFFLVIALVINFVLTGSVFAHALNPIFNWMPHELKNFDYLKSKGVSESTLEKLQKNSKRHQNEEKFVTELKKLITPLEFRKYGDLVQKTAMDVAADRLTRVIAWDETGEQMTHLLFQKGIQNISFIISREYQLSSALSFYLPYHPWPHSIEKPERNLWSPLHEVKKGPSIFVCELQECQGALNDFYKRFQLGLIYLGEIETLKDSRMIRNLQVYLVD